MPDFEALSAQSVNIVALEEKGVAEPCWSLGFGRLILRRS